MSTTRRTQRRYDHRLREMVRQMGDIKAALDHGVPRSTARTWLRQAKVEVVTLDILDMDAIRLQQEVLMLRRRCSRLVAVLRLMIVVLRISGYSLQSIRIALPSELL